MILPALLLAVSSAVVDPVDLRPGGEHHGTLSAAAPVVPVEIRADAAGPVTVEVHSPTCFTQLHRLDDSSRVVESDSVGLYRAHPQLVVEAGPAAPVRLEVVLVQSPHGEFVVRCYAGPPKPESLDAALEDALACYDATLAVHGKGSIDYGARAGRIGFIHMYASRREKAIWWLEKRHRTYERRLDPGHDWLLDSAYRVAKLQLREGRVDDASRLLRRAVDRCPDPMHPWVVRLRVQLGSALTRAGDVDGAEVELRRCIADLSRSPDRVEELAKARGPSPSRSRRPTARTRPRGSSGSASPG